MLNYLTKSLNRVCILSAFLLFVSVGLYSQSWSSEVSQAGFILKKVVSDTTIASGQAFSYTIYYTIPAGATNITITDNLPPSLEFLGHSVNNACGTPTVTAPALNTTGGTFTIGWASVPSGCAGSFTITVAFPNGVTCPNTTARNRACIMAFLNGKNYEFCTNFLTTTATAGNPWNINKYPLGTAWIGGNCPYATGNDTITYQVCVYKNVGTTGQLNLVNAVVRDTLPAGAQLVSSTCGATQSGNVITWNVGNLSAIPAYNAVCCNFTIYYPLAQFPNNTNISNTAYLSGSLGPTQQPCSNFSKSASTCVKKQVIQSGTISKWAYTNRQPGCAGQYLIYICNNGTTSLPVVAVDTVPNTLSGVSLGSVWPSSITATLNSGIVSINGSLAPGQCGYVYINFTIPLSATVGSNITNCVHLTSIQPTVSSCVTFQVDSVAPKACLWKEVCQKQPSYTPGSIFRYRLRIQNIGGAALSSTTLTDVLNPNLEYVGNPSFYTLNTWSVPNCKTNPTGSEIWNGVVLSNNSGTNTVTATIPSIPAVCQSIFYSSCGMYGTGGVPYYYIEFDVKVRDTAAMGNIPNKFTMQGGTLGNNTETSNTEFVLVTGVVGFNNQKGVKLPNDTTYTGSAIVTAGSQVDYRLKMNSSGTAPLSHITFADLLPRNASPADQLILSPCSNRTSQFDVTYNNIIGTPNPNPVLPYNNSTLSLANVNNLNPSGSPGFAFTTGCGTSGGWSSGLSTGMKNFGIYFGTTPVGNSGAEYKFSGLVSNNAKPGEFACNTFVSSGWTKHLIQSSILSYQVAGELESQPVCIMIDTTKKVPCLENIKIDVKCKGKDPATGDVIYTIDLSASSCAPATLVITSPHGTVSPSTHNITSSPWSISMTYTHNTNVNPVTLNYTLNCNGEICRDSIIRDLPPCDDPPVPPTDCCKEFKHTINTPKFAINSSTGYVGMTQTISAGPNQIQRFNATIVSAQLRRVCGPSPSSWARVFGDITGGSLVVTPGAGPQLLSLYSREAIWGQDSCVNWNNGANLKLNMLFPPFSGGKFCRDTLIFSVRYTFTDCKCVTCDTVATYKVVRSWQFLPWDIDPHVGIGIGVVRGSVNKNTDEVQQGTPDVTSLVMEDSDNGTFWIISPDAPENNVTIAGLEITSPQVKIESIKNGNNSGIVQDDVAYIDLNVKPGDASPTEIKFTNSSKLNKFNVHARFVYVIDGEEEKIFSEPVQFTALVPGAAKDDVAADKESKPTGVATYSIYLHNKNGYLENLSAISLNIGNSHKILAVGPPQSEDYGVILYPRKEENGSYKIGLNSFGELVMIGDKVAPIYLTLSGVTDVVPELDFNTFNEFGDIISSGTLQLTEPISKVNDDVTPGHEITKISVYPNPVNQSASVTINNLLTIDNARIMVQDLEGRVVATIADNVKLLSGSHIFNVNMNQLTNGTYFIVCTNGNNTVSQKFAVTK